MRRKVLWRALIAATLVSGGGFGGTAGIGLAGIGPATAKEFYTRKRVNGRWITGRFPKRGAGARDQEAGDARPSPRAGAGSTASTSPAGRAGALQVHGGGIPGPGSAPPGMPRMLVQPSAPMPARPGLPSASSQGPVSAEAPLGPAPDGERLGKLRQALQARASTLTGGSGDSEPGVRPVPEPQSVSLDFQSGIKTTVFSDGSMVREPFDVATLKSLASPPAETKGGR